MKALVTNTKTGITETIENIHGVLYAYNEIIFTFKDSGFRKFNLTNPTNPKFIINILSETLAKEIETKKFDNKKINVDLTLATK